MDNSVAPDFITKTYSTSNVKITPVMPYWQDKFEAEEKQKVMDQYGRTVETNSNFDIVVDDVE